MTWLLARTTIHNGQNSRASTAPNTQKRKHSESTECLLVVESSTILSSPPHRNRSLGVALAASPVDKRPTRQTRKKQKTSFRNLMSTENRWMNNSLARVKGLVELTDEEIGLNEKRRELDEKMRELEARLIRFRERMRELDERARELGQRRRVLREPSRVV